MRQATATTQATGRYVDDETIYILTTGIFDSPQTFKPAGMTREMQGGRRNRKSEK